MRKQLLESAKRLARGLGWEIVVVEDQGAKVQILLGAEGATEQEVCAPLHRIAAELGELGGPELYPATEEYDVPEVSPEPEPGTPLEPEALPETRPEMTHEAPVGIDGLHEDTSGYSEVVDTKLATRGISPKMAVALAEAIDPTGMPLCARPEGLFLPAEPEKEKKMNGVLATRDGKTFGLERNTDGRLMAPAGHWIQVGKGKTVQRFRSVNLDAWLDRGWSVAVVRA